MNIINGMDHYKRIAFIMEHLIFPVEDIEYLYSMEDKIKPKNFRAYYKVAICAKDSEIEALKQDKTTFSALYNKCLKRKNVYSVAFNDAKKLILQYRDLKKDIQTNIRPGKYSPSEIAAINNAIEKYDLKHLINRL